LYSPYNPPINGSFVPLDTFVPLDNHRSYLLSGTVDW
jgi:hypothetical protein